MNNTQRQTSRGIIVPAGHNLWMNHHTLLLSIAIFIMALIALLRMDIEFYRLLWDTGPGGAIDLRLRYEEVNLWFAGKPVYGALKHAVYPPASYTTLWPFMGWLTLTQARWLWAAASVVMLVWLAYLLLRESNAKARLERAFIVLLIISMYATSVTIGNGQLILHILPALLTGLFLIKCEGKWYRDLLGSFLVVMAMVSPSITAPFFWAVLFVPGRVRPAVFVVIGYIILTLLAVKFQEASLVSLIGGWLRQSQLGAAWGATHGGYGNLHSCLAALGLEFWNQTASLLTLGALGAWVYSYRRIDLWILLGVSAIVARVWTYHRLYNDLLILLPMIAIFRIAKSGTNASEGVNLLAGGILAIAFFAVLAPARLLTSPPPWNWLMMAGQVALWLLMLVFLVYKARLEKNKLAIADHPESYFET